ncbi:MAG: TlpA disulfide reductase family protein [Fuerstiella sp.]|nr:TlpA disulfide reductase family protein [Fuerstiella sp.]
MKLSNFAVHVVIVLAVIGSSTVKVPAQVLKESFLGSGVTSKVGGYRPVRSVMDKKPETVKVAPGQLETPRYGLIQIGEQSWAYILDERAEADDVLYIDTNGDGDLTNDPKAEWTSSKQGEFRVFRGSGQIELAKDRIGVINLYRFDPADPRRASLKDTILFYTDFGYEYHFELDEREFSTIVSGAPTETTRFSVDRDSNGKISRRFEQAAIGTSFNFTGTTYVFRLNDGAVSLEKAPEELEQMPLPPNLEIGRKALEFVATTMDDVEISFPGAYAGKIVMLDFWATWCGPCIGEIPNMKKAYVKWHDRGFDILGISFDRADMDEKILAFLNERELPWPQIYEGKMWDTTLGHMHDVSGIPFVLLVDGDSGEILATAKQLRGPGLSDFIRRALEDKFDIKLADEPDDAAEGEKTQDGS